MKYDFISFILLCDSIGKNCLMVASKASSAFARIIALPARNPEESSVLGNSCRLKFPSLIVQVCSED